MRGTDLATDTPLDLAKLRHHLEVLADALAGPGKAQVEREGADDLRAPR
jgi:hypothetical protein